MIPVANDFDATIFEEGVSPCIASGFTIFVVLAAVQLDGQFQFIAIEIQYVRWKGMLTSEFEPQQTPIAHQKPKQGFWTRLLCAQLAGEIA